jgi:hypothetical protein
MNLTRIQPNSRRLMEDQRTEQGMAKVMGHDDIYQVANIGLTVAVLYALACFLPCVDCGPAVAHGDLDFSVFERGYHVGFEILLLGWSGGNNGVPWSANVFLALGWFCLWTRRLRLTAALGLIAVLVGLTTWWARRHDTLMVGYYFWQASHFVLFVGALWTLRRSARQLVWEGSHVTSGGSQSDAGVAT